MKTIHREHEITVTREQALGGWTQIYYSIFRASDGYECASGFCDCSETVHEFTEHLKARIDSELAESNPWGEHEEKDN